MYRFAVAFGCFISIVLSTGCQCLDHRYMGCGYESGMTAPSTSCGNCGDCGDCGGQCAGYKPGHPLGNLMGCTSGCGEVYWGEWTSDPPDCCDPCDNCGNWVGPRYRGFPFVQHLLAGLHSALSGQCVEMCGGCDACLSAASAGEVAYADEGFVEGWPTGEVYMAPEQTKSASPTQPSLQSPAPTPAARPQARYQQRSPGSPSFLNLPSHRTAYPASSTRTVMR